MPSLMETITDDDNLHAAWRKVRANHGAPGADAVRLADYEANLTEHLSALQARLRDETYLPLPLRRASIPKKSGGIRELAIPAISDRVAQRAFVNVLEPLFEQMFLPCSYGYRTGRSVNDAVQATLRYREAGCDWILDADIQDFFPSVDHTLLMAQLRRSISDRAALRTIALWLEAGALNRIGTAKPSLLTEVGRHLRETADALLGGAEGGTEEDEVIFRKRAAMRQFGAEAVRLAWSYRQALVPLLTAKALLVGGSVGAAGLAAFGAVALGRRLRDSRPRCIGTPQGSPLSPLLANVYLHPFDAALTKKGLRLVRYADDFLICCPSEARARQAESLAREALTELRLTLHPEKTRIIACNDPFAFLGYAFDQDGAFPAKEGAIAPSLRTVSEAGNVAVQTIRSGGRAALRKGTGFTKDIIERAEELRGGKD